MNTNYFLNCTVMMKRLFSCALFCLAPLFFNGCDMPVAHETTKSVSSFPKIDRVPNSTTIGGNTLSSLPHYDTSSGAMWQMDLRGTNLSQLDLREKINDLFYADFDSRTIWPDSSKMPPGFDYNHIMELGKNPGLGIRSLHSQGITGTGVGIAVLDQTLLTNHEEYGDRLRLYEEIGTMATMDAQMHAPAVASIAVGKTVGVAPGADLYFIAESNGIWDAKNGITWDFHDLAHGVWRILDINKQLPQDRKIRVLSMSIGWDRTQAGYDEITNAVNEAKADGMLVVSSSIEEVHGFKFNALGRDPLADPDSFESYVPGMFWANDFYANSSSSFYTDRLLVPMDSRCTASPTGINDYVFYREGGWSWSIPYIAGMYALCAQVKPGITPDIFWSKALSTGRFINLSHNGETIRFGPILDPAALIGAL
jgi:hypothetical protein